MKLTSFTVISLSLALSSSASHGFLKKRLNVVTNDNIDKPGSSPSPATNAPYAGPTPVAAYQSGKNFYDTIFAESLIYNSLLSRHGRLFRRCHNSA